MTIKHEPEHPAIEKLRQAFAPGWLIKAVKERLKESNGKDKA